MAAEPQIVVGWVPGSAEEWHRAFEAPEGELPALSAEEHGRAAAEGIPETEIRRYRLVNSLAHRRAEERGRELARLVGQILAESGVSAFHLDRVVLRAEPGPEAPTYFWRLMFSGPRPYTVPVPGRLAAEAREHVLAAQRQIKQIVLEGLGQTVKEGA